MRFGTSSGSGVSNGVLLVGDANGFIDPLTGEGIPYALQSGQFAAETAAAALSKGDTSHAGLASYEDRWRSAFADEFRTGARILDLLMKRPGLIDLMVEVCHARRSFAVRLGEVFSGIRPKRDLFSASMLAQIGLGYLRRLLPKQRGRFFFE